MGTLAEQRAVLNAEVGIANDADTAPWTVAQRNQALSDGYKALWAARAWKPVMVTVPTVDDTNIYAGITGIRRLGFAELLDADGMVAGYPHATLREDGTGGYELTVPSLSGGLTLNLHGWTAYKSTFSGDSDTDDLPDEFSRLPVVKAKALLYRTNLATFARFGDRTRVGARTDVNLAVSDLLAIIASAEQEWMQGVHDLEVQRPRYGRSLKRRL